MGCPSGERFARTALLFSPEQLDRLWHAHVMIFGVGGVGSYAAEALCRSGIGKLSLVDGDTVDESNINRQLPAMRSTLGRPKAGVVRERLLDIAPDAQVEAIEAFHLPGKQVLVPQDTAFLVDAVDTVAAKIDLALIGLRRGIPMITCMGMGNRLDPTQIRMGDLFETSGCPLCRVMRRELRKRGVISLRCVYSTEPVKGASAQRVLSPDPEARLSKPITGRADSMRPPPGSVAYVPAVAGLYMAYEVVRVLCGEVDKE